MEEGAYYLPGTVTGERETIVTSTVDARPQYILNLPGPGWAPLVSAVFTAAFFLLLTIKAVVPALISGVIAIAGIVWWMWPADPGPKPPADIGGGIRLPINIVGRKSHSWMATIVLAIVMAMIFASIVFAHFFLWTSSEEWVPDGVTAGDWWRIAVSAALLVATSVAVMLAGRSLPQPGGRPWPFVALLGVAATALMASFGIDVWNVLDGGVSPTASGYGATLFAIIGYQGFIAAALFIVAGFVIAKGIVGRIDKERRATFDTIRLLLHYAVIQGLIALFIVHPFPEIG